MFRLPLVAAVCGSHCYSNSTVSGCEGQLTVFKAEAVLSLLSIHKPTYTVNNLAKLKNDAKAAKHRLSRQFSVPRFSLGPSSACPTNNPQLTISLQCSLQRLSRCSLSKQAATHACKTNSITMSVYQGWLEVIFASSHCFKEKK